MRAITPALSIALSHLQASVSDDDDWYEPVRMLPLEVHPSLAPCRRLLYVTKWAWLARLLPDALPDDVVVIHRGTLLPAAHAQAVARLATTLNAKLLFVGDLDPYDITTYLSLTSGGWPAGGPSVDVDYFGIDERWLSLCESSLGGREIRSVCLPMTPFECKNLELLESNGVDVGAIVGARALALLESGHKLELEGASNPEFYVAGFPIHLLEHIFDKPVGTGSPDP